LGNTLKKTDTITPEAIITANTNDWLYYFGLYAPVITTTFSIITAFFSVMALLAR
jgi:hypothetical protein